ncbi:MAG: lipase family protein [Gordonia sp. (in: high G+C Gram-positive bacteria)]|uniref:lipase family protein n=1 Tax=Gordonia sp. (in: high G+C Gram-positive bacteria) TaxID=84139 RepID=UPI003C71FDB6
MTTAKSRFTRTRVGKTLVVTTAAAAVAVGSVTGAQAFADPAEAVPEQGGQTAGSVYANRVIAPTSLIAGAARGQEYTYWSPGSDERLHLSTATLLEPKGKTPSAGWPVLVWAHASNGWNQSCAPSKTRNGADDAAVTRLLKQGYAVISPDYAAVGMPGAPQYSDVSATAHNIVDAVRAGSDVGESDLSPKWAVVGEGQGASAAVELARNGASWQSGRLDFRGATATSIPAGYDDLVTNLSPSSQPVPTGVVADVLYTLAAQEPDDVKSILSTRGTALVEQARTLCSAALAKEIGGTQLADLVSRPLSSNAKLAAALRKSLAIPSRGFSRPVLMSQRLMDPTVVVPTSLEYVTQAQFASNKVTMKTYLTGDDAAARKQERSAVDAYLEDLF